MKHSLFKQILLLVVSTIFLTANASISLPWSETFDTKDAFGAFTIIDANDDGKQWEFNNAGTARVAYNSKLAMDDWIISPPVMLAGGKNYKFSIDAAMTSFGPEKFEVLAGNAPEIAAMAIQIIPVTEVNSNKMVTFTGEFYVPRTGEWYIGVHGCSDADMLYLTIDNITLIPDTSTDLLSVPFELKPTAKDIETFTILDLNEDAGNYDRWKYQTNLDGLVSPSSSTHAEDDWAFTPAINFSTGFTYYELTFNAYTNMPAPHSGTVEIYLGTECSPESMVTKIGELNNFASPERDQKISFRMPFLIPSAGHYYIGFHCVTSRSESIEAWPIVFQNIGVAKSEGYNVKIHVDDSSRVKVEFRNNLGKKQCVDFSVTNVVSMEWISNLDMIITATDGNILTSVTVDAVPEYIQRLSTSCLGYNPISYGDKYIEIISKPLNKKVNVTIKTDAPDRLMMFNDNTYASPNRIDGFSGEITCLSFDPDYELPIKFNGNTWRDNIVKALCNGIDITNPNDSYYELTPSDGEEYCFYFSDNIAPSVYTIPVEFDLAVKNTFDAFRSIDNNGDGKDFQFLQGIGASIGYNPQLDMDDWMFSPEICVKDIKNLYEFTTVLRNSNSYFTEHCEIYWGLAPTVDAMTNLVLNLMPSNGVMTEYVSAPLSFDDTKSIYIGIHGCSKQDMARLDVRNVGIRVHEIIEDNPTEFLTIGKTETRAGASVEIPFAIANSSSLLGFQADIYLGDGASFRQNGDEYEVTLTSERSTARHLVKSSLLADGALRVMALSIDNTPFVGNVGDIFKLKVYIAPDATGPIAINVRNIRLSEKTDNKISEVTLNDCAGEISLKSYRLGDMDDNGSLSINDVTNLIELVLDNMPDGIIPQAGDIDGNGVYSVNDVTLLTDYVLRGEWPVETRITASTMSVSATVEVQDDELVIPLSFGGTDEITAFQADIRLPEGMAVRELAVDKTNADFSCRFREIEPGKVRVIGYSPSLSTLKGDSPVSLILEVNPGCSRGEVELSAMQAVNSDFVELDAAPLRLDISQSALASITAHDVDVRTVGQTVVVSGPIGGRVTVHDVFGRVVAAWQLSDTTESFALASTGIYMVSVDNKVFKTILR